MDLLPDTMTPGKLGLPSKFKVFRPVQKDALEWAHNTDAPVIGCNMPTGTGKTLFAVAHAKLTIAKTMYLVATKALEKQVMFDFSSIGMVNVHGRANYDCKVYRDCDEGFDQKCSRANTLGCDYTKHVEDVKDSMLGNSNYSYWLRARSASRGALERPDNPITLLVCDEAHTIERHLTDFMSVTFTERELRRFTFSDNGRLHDHIGGCYQDKDSEDSKRWFDYADYILKLHGDSEEEDAKDWCDRCRKVKRMNGNWVWQRAFNGSITLSPVRLSSYTKQLFSGVPKVLLMSASLDEFTCRMLIPSDMGFEYKSFPYQFPTGNAPVYHIPTVKLTWKSQVEDYQYMIKAADVIIDARPGRKAIMHTVSYERARTALLHSRHANRFIWNKSTRDLTNALNQFRAGTGSILVTPSVEEGFDFPGLECEYQILLKFPFPNELNRVVKERCSSIPGYRLHYAAQKVNQIKGRPLRSETDRSELFILDNACRQILTPEGRSYCSPGFRLFTVNQVPPAPPRVTH